MQNKFCFADHRGIEQGETQLPFSTILNMMHISKVVWETSHNQAKWNYSHALVLTQSLSKVAWFQSLKFAIGSHQGANNYLKSRNLLFYTKIHAPWHDSDLSCDKMALTFFCCFHALFELLRDVDDKIIPDVLP